MKSTLKIALLITIPVVLILVILIGLLSRRGGAQVTEEHARVVAAQLVTLQRQPVPTTVEVPGTVVAVQHAELSPKVMSRLAAVYVHEGDRVVAGQILAQLEGKDLAANVQQAQAGVLNAEAAYQQAKTGYVMQQTQSSVAVQQAQAALSAAQAQLAKAKQGPRPEQVAQADHAEQRARAGLDQAIAGLTLVKEGARSQQKLQADQAVLAAQGQVAQAEAGLATAKAQLANVQTDFDRMSNLYKQDIVPKQRLDSVATMLEAAKQGVQMATAGVNQAKAGLEMAKAQASLVHEGARTQEVVAAEKQVEQARAGYEQARQEAAMAHQGGRWEDIKAAEEGVRQAEAGLRAAQAARARDKVSEKDMARAAAGIAQARAGLSGASTMAGYTAIVAPFSGVITARKADPGNMAMPQMPVVALDDDSLYQLVSQVPERQAARMAKGGRVQVKLDALGLSLPATIAEIVPAADPASRTLTVKANLPHAAGVQSGLFGRMTLVLGSAMQLSLPADAIVERNGLTGVYTVDEGGITRYSLITVGAETQGRVTVLSGLQAGERVVVSDVDRIKPGQRVNVEGAAQ
jgi:RND family efflux transporter MFP subunit